MTLLVRSFVSRVDKLGTINCLWDCDGYDCMCHVSNACWDMSLSSIISTKIVEPEDLNGVFVIPQDLFQLT